MSHKDTQSEFYHALFCRGYIINLPNDSCGQFAQDFSDSPHWHFIIAPVPVKQVWAMMSSISDYDNGDESVGNQ